MTVISQSRIALCDIKIIMELLYQNIDFYFIFRLSQWLAFGARGPRFDPRDRQRKQIPCPNMRSLVSFAGVMLKYVRRHSDRDVNRRKSHPLCGLKNATVICKLTPACTMKTCL